MYSFASISLNEFYARQLSRVKSDFIEMLFSIELHGVFMARIAYYWHYLCVCDRHTGNIESTFRLYEYMFMHSIVIYSTTCLFKFFERTDPSSLLQNQWNVEVIERLKSDIWLLHFLICSKVFQHSANWLTVSHRISQLFRSSSMNLCEFFFWIKFVNWLLNDELLLVLKFIINSLIGMNAFLLLRREKTFELIWTY